MDQKLSLGVVTIVPPEGVLREAAETAMELSSGEGTLRHSFLIARFHGLASGIRIEAVVADWCSWCGELARFLVELCFATGCRLTLYNASRVKPPIEALYIPCIRVEGLHLIHGVSFNQVVESLHDTLVDLIAEREGVSRTLEVFAREHGVVLCPDPEVRRERLAAITKAKMTYGKLICPLKPSKTCPCLEAITEAKAYGVSRCGLFWSERKARQWIHENLVKWTDVIKEVELTKNLLDTLPAELLKGAATAAIGMLIARVSKIVKATLENKP